jgi:hypothetical protein
MLPLFSDWRIAYLNNFGVLHALALNGMSDFLGPTLGLDVQSVTISPDGRALAYHTGPKWGPVVLVHLQARTLKDATLQLPIIAGDLSPTDWSPDGSQLVIPGTWNGQQGLYQVDVAHGTTSQVPQTGPNGTAAGLAPPVLGWTDHTHIIVSLSGGQGEQLFDLTTGTLTPLTLPPFHSISRISPDGRQALIWMSCSPDCCGVGPATQPDVAIYDFASGTVRHLPAITAATSGQPVTNWQPGSNLAVGMLMPNQPQAATMALFDLDTDTVTPLQHGVAPMSWTPDGNAMLLTGSTDSATYFTESPVAPTTQPIPLPVGIEHIVGFVRTEGAAHGDVTPAPAMAEWNTLPLIAGRSVTLHVPTTTIPLSACR